jgi:hypothetical protein
VPPPPSPANARSSVGDRLPFSFPSSPRSPLSLWSPGPILSGETLVFIVLRSFVPFLLYMYFRHTPLSSFIPQPKLPVDERF